MITITLAPGENPGKIDFTVDNSWEASIGSIGVPGNGYGESWVSLSAKISDVYGVHALWLRFIGEDEELFKVDWFQFINNK